MKFAAQALLFLIAISIAIAWKSYAYGDCRKVGHARMYCILSIGR